MKFQDAIEEYRYFDQNLNPVQTREEAKVMVGRTNCNNHGKKWHGLDPVSHTRRGEGTLEEAILQASTHVISDNAASAVIDFIDEGYQGNNRRKTWGVVVDGERIASFHPRYYGREYSLLDIAGEQVRSAECGWGTVAEADTKGNFDNIVRRWLELIPSQADIETRDAERAAEKAREEAEQAEAQRIATIEEAGPEMLAALKKIEEQLNRGLTHHAVSIARAAIAKAEGSV